MIEKIKKLNLLEKQEKELILFMINNFNWTSKQIEDFCNIIEKIKEEGNEPTI